MSSHGSSPQTPCNSWDPPAARFLPNSEIEVICEPAFSDPPRFALFDFDGTLSLIREGWQGVMSALMQEFLSETPECESATELAEYCHQFVHRTAGLPTIAQMETLAAEVACRQGTPLAPMAYKEIYVGRLMAHVDNRRESLRSGRMDPADLLIAGTRELLLGLRERGVTLYVASGTDEHFVREEVALLGLADDFGPHVYGARDHDLSFSKAKVIAEILSADDIPGEALVGFGDGFVEIENTKQAGGFAVGVASDEQQPGAAVDLRKRRRLIEVGADVVVPDFRDWDLLIRYIWDR